MARKIKGNLRTVTTTWFDADQQSKSIAGSLLAATLPFSPMAAGVHDPSTQVRGYAGLPGYGVSRFAGRTVEPLQVFYGAIQPVATPVSRRLGLGAMVSGQPGMPQSGYEAAGGLADFGGQLNHLAMGS